MPTIRVPYIRQIYILIVSCRGYPMWCSESLPRFGRLSNEWNIESSVSKRAVAHDVVWNLNPESLVAFQFHLQTPKLWIPPLRNPELWTVFNGLNFGHWDVLKGHEISVACMQLSQASCFHSCNHKEQCNPDSGHHQSHLGFAFAALWQLVRSAMPPFWRGYLGVLLPCAAWNGESIVCSFVVSSCKTNKMSAR